MENGIRESWKFFDGFFSGEVLILEWVSGGQPWRLDVFLGVPSLYMLFWFSFAFTVASSMSKPSEKPMKCVVMLRSVPWIGERIFSTRLWLHFLHVVRIIAPTVEGSSQLGFLCIPTQSAPLI